MITDHPLGTIVRAPRQASRKMFSGVRTKAEILHLWSVWLQSESKFRVSLDICAYGEFELQF